MLKPEHALLIGGATAGVVFGVYQISLPPVASVAASAPGNIHIDTARQKATITAASLVALLGLLSRDPTVFVVGGLAVIAMDFSHRHANATDNRSGQLAGSSSSTSSAPSSASASITVQGT